MSTRAAARCFAVPGDGTVLSRAALRQRHITPSQLRSRLDAGRWRRRGRAIVLHNGPLTRRQEWDVALVNLGPRAALTAFTAAEYQGLSGWERDEIHALVPAGTAEPGVPGLAIRVHRSRHWQLPADPVALRCHGLGGALVLAAAGFHSPRPACGLLAAGVQQGLIEAAELARILQAQTTVRHRALLLAAVADIGGGSEALSEIDFVRLCRRYGLPTPERQSVRRDSSGRRRYLDASWRRADGRMVVAEIDGALHLSPRRWWDDQARQNELVLADALVLRFPSVIVRTQPEVVAAQVRRALAL
jgi:hypothetical protein